MDSLLDGLNLAQQQAVQYEGAALAVAAGPGSGKTRVVSRRIAYRILERGVRPDRMLAVTFTNRAAREMSARVQALVDTPVGTPIGTFHWMCAGILRRHIRVLGYRSDFRVLPPWEARKLLQTVLHAEENDATSLARAMDVVGGLKSGVEIGSLAARYALSVETMLHIACAYQRTLKRCNALDLDDLPHLAATILKEYPHVRDQCRRAIDELLVDEYQDTNVVQQELVELLAPSNGTVMVVGDEDQAIYGWRHADAGGFRRFLDAFPTAQVATLERSYRHHKYVARAANALIARDETRLKKSIHTELPAGNPPVCFVAADEYDEAEWITSEIIRLTSTERMRWSDIAVLYRVNAQSRALEDALVRRSIPYRVLSGRSFYARDHVQRVFAYLRLALDSEDNGAAELLLRTIPGLGDSRLAELRQWAEANEVTVMSAVGSARRIPRLPQSLRSALEAAHGCIAEVAGLRKGPLQPVVEAAVLAAERDLEREGRLTESVVEDFGELRAMATLHQERRGTLRSLLESASLDDLPDDSTDAVEVMSLHSAKGLEYRAVFILGVEEGLLPHARALQQPGGIDEERRLCYVGMTRAKEKLYLSYAQARLLSGRGGTGQPSRFIQEIGPHNMVLEVTTAKRIKPRLAATRTGDRVRHTRWGAGTVERVEGTGRDTLTTIVFDMGERRRLQLCHAPLSIDGESPSDVSTG